MRKQAVRIVSQTPFSLHLYLELKYEMSEVFTVLLYKGPLPSMQIGSAYLTSMGLHEICLYWWKRKKKEGGVQFSSFHCYWDNSHLKSLPRLPQTLSPFQWSKWILSYCRIQPYFSIYDVLSHQVNESWPQVTAEVMQKWQFLIT